MIIGKVSQKKHLSETELREIIKKGLSKINFKNKKVLVLIPDDSRSGPTDFFFKQFCKIIGKTARRLDFLIALGTHPPMTHEEILAHLKITQEEHKHKYAKFNIYNHMWKEPAVFRTIGMITEDEINKISGGLFKENVAVSVNRLIFEYNIVIIYGPVFPHEVVGFSGGYKYIFPGIAGAEIINFFHWLGAVITNININGTKHTPVRKVIDKAATFIKRPVHCFCSVVENGKVKGLFIGKPKEAWSKAADLSSEIHIVYKDKPYRKVLGIAPSMYKDIWTAGKVMYKLEPIVQDGGELIIYAPHITEVSHAHGKVLEKICYHVRDYFLKQMEKFLDIPRGVMAHSTHVKGIGTFEDGVEKPRINVTLATGITEETCKKINLGYRDPKEINIKDWEKREDEGILVVHHAGEVLHKLKKGSSKK